MKNAAELALVMCSTIDRFQSNHTPRFLTGECGTISALPSFPPTQVKFPFSNFFRVDEA